MDVHKMEELQKKIEQILANNYTPQEIADSYLNTPFYKRPLPPDPDAENKARGRLKGKWKWDNEPEQHINEIIRAVGFYEIPVLCEHHREKVTATELDFTATGIDKHLAEASFNLERVNQDLKALCRVLETQPLSHTATIELHSRRIQLKQVVEQGFVYISRQQEVALKWLSHCYVEALPLIQDFVLAREPRQPEQTYTRALALIVFRLIESNTPRNTSTSERFTVDTIATISPLLKKYVTARTIKAARTGQ